MCSDLYGLAARDQGGTAADPRDLRELLETARRERDIACYEAQVQRELYRTIAAHRDALTLDNARLRNELDGVRDAHAAATAALRATQGAGAR